MPEIQRNYCSSIEEFLVKYDPQWVWKQIKVFFAKKGYKLSETDLEDAHSAVILKIIEMRTIEKYDPTRGVPFVSYVSRAVIAALMKFLHDHEKYDFLNGVSYDRKIDPDDFFSQTLEKYNTSDGGAFVRSIEIRVALEDFRKLVLDRLGEKQLYVLDALCAGKPRVEIAAELKATAASVYSWHKQIKELLNTCF